MPHQCTGCGHTFEDGSKEMLSGCPNCGGNKFQFHPVDAAPDGELDDPPPDPEGPTSATDTSSVAETVGRATTKVRDIVSGDPDPDPDAAWPSDADAGADSSAGAFGSGSGFDDASDRESSDDESEIIDADARRLDADETGDEDTAQANARSDVVSSSEVVSSSDASTSTPPPETDEAPPESEGRVVSEPDPDGSDLDVTELREQLNDQFESIRIVEPGQYELNLMELYDREEYIIALQENGRYVIQVPEQWIGDAPER